jgi:hypothetical protein
MLTQDRRTGEEKRCIAVIETRDKGLLVTAEPLEPLDIAERHCSRLVDEVRVADGTPFSRRTQPGRR